MIGRSPRLPSKACLIYSIKEFPTAMIPMIVATKNMNAMIAQIKFAFAKFLIFLFFALQDKTITEIMPIMGSANKSIKPKYAPVPTTLLIDSCTCGAACVTTGC